MDSSICRSRHVTPSPSTVTALPKYSTETLGSDLQHTLDGFQTGHIQTQTYTGTEQRLVVLLILLVQLLVLMKNKPKVNQNTHKSSFPVASKVPVPVALQGHGRGGVVSSLPRSPQCARGHSNPCSYPTPRAWLLLTFSTPSEPRSLSALGLPLKQKF